MRRWTLVWTRQNGAMSQGHRFFTRRAAERSAARLSMGCGYPKIGEHPTSPVDVAVRRAA